MYRFISNSNHKIMSISPKQESIDQEYEDRE